MSVLIIVRHGQSVYNLENRFTGWQDVELTPKGKDEAKLAGEKLKGFTFDIAYTSALKRAQHTLQIIMEEAGITDLPVVADAALNERAYGDLEGLNKGDIALKYGVEQVKIWRRSYDISPPNGESLKVTAERVLPYFEREIAPRLRTGEDILIVAHGNSLRALTMYLEKLSPEQILEVEIPTGTPKKYELDADLNVLSSAYL